MCVHYIYSADSQEERLKGERERVRERERKRGAE